MSSIQHKLLAANSSQANVDHKVRDMSFQASENVLLKVLPIEGVMIFRKKGKLSMRYIGSLEVIGFVCLMAYRLALPPNLSGDHSVFHTSM